LEKFTSEQNRKFWDEYALKSKDCFFGAHSDNHIVELENKFIISELKSRKTSNLFDIGCGNGQRTLLFSKYVDNQTLGIDYSEKMIQEAKTLLLKNVQAKNNLSFEVCDIHDFSKKMSFDVITSCRCFINQPSHEKQIKLFELLYEKLSPDGSLIIAEVSVEGIKNLNSIRKKFGLNPINIKSNNLQISENAVFSKIKDLYSIEKINRLGIYYYISRVLHPAFVYPNEPQPNSKLNELAMKTETLFQNESNNTMNCFEKMGAQLLVHFKKKS